MEVPEDFIKALKKKPNAKRFYESLGKSNRYAIAYGLTTAKKPETRQRRFEKFIDMLEREEKPSFGFKEDKPKTNKSHINAEVASYNQAQTSEEDRQICETLALSISKLLIGAECKIWHRHPVWFLDGNPIVGYSRKN